MALRTTEDEDTKLNPSQSDYDRRFNDIAKAEMAGSYNNESLKTKDNDNITKVKNSEETPSDWKTNVNPLKAPNQPITLKGVIKKRGPLGLIILLLGGGGLAMGGIFSGGGLLITLAENLKSNVLNSTPSVLQLRGRQILNKQLSGVYNKAIAGICTPVSIRCRFATMSKRQISLLEKAGVSVETEGKVFGVGRNKVTSLEFEGEPIKTPAELRAKLASNTRFARAFSKSYNSRLVTYSSSAFSRVLGSIGSTKLGNLARTSLESMRKSLVERVSGATQAAADAKLTITQDKNGKLGYVDENGAPVSEAAANARMAEVNSRFKNTMAAKKAATSTQEFFTKTSVKATLIGVGAVSIACTAWNIVRSAAAASRYLGSLQLASYTMVFLNTADSIKAGDATPEQVEYLGNILTKSNSEGVAAMDSRGMRNVLYGDTSPIPTTTLELDEKGDPTDASLKSARLDAEVTQYVNGAGVNDTASTSILKNIPGVSGASDSLAYESADKICGYINSTVGGGLMVATGVLMSAACFVSAALTLGGTAGACVSDIAIQAGVALSLMGVIAIANNKVASMFSGTLINGNENGNQAGNAIASGAGAINTQTGLSSGLGLLNKTDAVAFQSVKNEVSNEFAAIDRIDHSPLDASNPNTFMGKVALSLSPYLSKFSSVGSSLISLSKLPQVSLMGLFGTVQAKPYSDAAVCTDVDYKDYATDINCNPIVGQTQETLDIDIDTVLDYMINNHHIDEITGEATSTEYKDYGEYCTNRQTALGTYPEGKIPNDVYIGKVCRDGYSGDNAEMYRMFKAYNSYIVAEEGMSGESINPPITQNPTVSTGNSATPDDFLQKGSGWTLKDGFDYSATSCATGSTDSGLYTHPVRGFTIRKCSVGGGIVASVVSEKVVAMFESAKSLGINLSLSSGFRSYEDQSRLYASNCNSNGDCSPATAKPGNSQHEAGLALDIEYNNNTICFSPKHLSGANCHGNAGYDWLNVNARSYGFFNLPEEAWHWSASGN